MPHLFHIGEVMLKVGGNSAAAFAWKPAQNFHLRWSRSIGFLMQNLYLEAAASSLGLLGRKLKQLFNSQHCFGSTSCWRLDRTASAFSDTLELFVSQSCEEFSGRACDQYHHESFEHQDGDDRRARSKEQGNKRTMRTKQGATDKYEVSSHLAITSARASVTSSNSVCSPSNNPLHSSSCTWTNWRNQIVGGSKLENPNRRIQIGEPKLENPNRRIQTGEP